MNPAAIDWAAVAEARRRGKLGSMRPGDQELCEAAIESDPERYREMSRRVVNEVIDEMRILG